MKTIFSSAIGFMAVVTFILSIQCKSKKDILKLQLFANILYAAQYFLLSAFTACFMNLISAVRCYIFKNYDKKALKIFLYIFIFLIIIVGIISYQNLLSLIPVIITLAYIISTYGNNTKVIRIVFLICSLIWFYYNFSVKAYISLIGNVFEFISGLTAIIRYEKKKKSITTL